MTEPANHLHATVSQYLSSEKIAAGYDEYFNDSALFKTDCDFISSEITPPGKVLDAGCGTGRHLVYLEKRGFRAYGLDLSSYFIEVARKKLIAANLPQRLFLGDILNPPLPENLRFSAVILMFSVLGMIKGSHNRIKALNGISRILEPDGKIILHIHNRNYNSNLAMEKLRQLRGRLRKPDPGHEEGDQVMKNYRGLQDLYLHCFSLAEINSTISAAGLRICSLLPLNSQRDGICRHKDINRHANGFLLSAQSINIHC